MRIKLLLIMLITCVSCKPKNASNLKITNGKLSSLKSSVVSLTIYKRNGSLGNCTGSIIKEKGFLMLLTASHCLKDMKEVYIVDSRRPNESMSQWRARVTGRGNKSVKVSVQANQSYYEATGSLNRAEHDFAMGLIKESETDPELYKNFKRNALSIGYDVDVNPEKLSGHIKYIGAGATESMTEYGVLKEGNFNIAPRESSNPNTLIVDVCDIGHFCTKTRPGDSGSPLLYQDPETKENKVIGVLLGGRTESESLYSNLGGNRFPNQINGIIEALDCQPKK